MLTRPAVLDAALVACLRDDFALPIGAVTFLPLGADRHTAVYRATTNNSAAYFVKLRSGGFDEWTIALMDFLAGDGIAQIIAPRRTARGALWTSLENYRVTVCPFVEGDNGYNVSMTEGQWRELGEAVRRIHMARLPPPLARRLRQEAWDPRGRAGVRAHVARADADSPVDEIAAEMTAVLKERRGEILGLVVRAEALARELEGQPREFVLCHGDLHAGNLLLGRGESLHLVDWDDALMAPKEKDLMSVGGGLWGDWRKPHEEEALFYAGYGPAQIDAVALAYYRHERIVQDIAVECEMILQSEGDEADRARELRFLKSNFLPGGTIEMARRAGGNTR